MTKVLFAATVFVWGTSWYSLRLQIGHAPVEVSMAYRFILSALMLGLLLWITGRLRPVDRSAHRYFAAMGLCMFGVNFYFFYNAASYVATGLSSVVFTIAAIYNALNQWLYFRKPPSVRVLAGSALGTIGVACLSWDQLHANSGQAWIGILLSLAGTYCFSTGNMVSVMVTKRGIDLPNAIFRGMCWGALGCTASVFLQGKSFVVPASLQYWLAALWLAAAASVVGFISYLTLVNRLGADRAAYVTVLCPLIALTLSTFLESYEWHWMGALGIASILAGCVLVFARLGNIVRMRPRLKSREACGANQAAT
jgi:drug/metabolite transporter (DMT)-like permease